MSIYLPGFEPDAAETVSAQMQLVPPRKLKEYQSMPEGWRVVDGATTAPRGFVVISNGKSHFAPGRESGLLRKDRIPAPEKPAEMPKYQCEIEGDLR